MPRLRPALLAALASVPLAAAGASSPGPRPDPEAMREARRSAGERSASPRAIAHYLEARRRQRAGDPEGAIAELRLAVTWDEASPELRVSLASALLEAGRVEPAEEEARRGLELAKGSPTAGDAEVVLARAALARREPEAAVLALREAIRIETAAAVRGEPDPEPWRLLADVYADRGDPDAAARTLDDLARLSPEDAAAGHRELGRRAVEAGAPGRAEGHLLRAAALDPGDPDSRRLLAAAYEALRRISQARDAQLAVLRLEPDDPEAELALGRYALRDDDVDGAREWFRRHVRDSADPADAQVRCAFEWLDDERAEAAIQSARAGLAEVGPDPRLRLAEGLGLLALRRFPEAVKSLELVPPAAGEIWVPARASLAEALSRSGRHAEAERALEPVVAARPADTRVVTARARVRLRAGHPGEAATGLRNALAGRDRSAPGSDVPELTAALADALVSAGKPDEALSVLRDALASRPRDAALNYSLGSILDRAGRPEEAVAQMRALLVLDPDHAEAMNFIAYQWAERGVRLDEAERLVRRALELSPRAGHMHDTLGWVLYRKGDPAGAMAALERSLALSGPEPTVLEHLGDALAAQGRKSDATRAWRRALAEPGDGDPGEEVRRRAALERKLRGVQASHTT